MKYFSFLYLLVTKAFAVEILHFSDVPEFKNYGAKDDGIIVYDDDQQLFFDKVCMTSYNSLLELESVEEDDQFKDFIQHVGQLKYILIPDDCDLNNNSTNCGDSFYALYVDFTEKSSIANEIDCSDSSPIFKDLEKEVPRILYQCLQVIKYMHSELKITHGRINTETILMKNSSTCEEGYALSSLGSATPIEDSIENGQKQMLCDYENLAEAINSIVKSSKIPIDQFKESKVCSDLEVMVSKNLDDIQSLIPKISYIPKIPYIPSVDRSQTPSSEESENSNHDEFLNESFSSNNLMWNDSYESDENDNGSDGDDEGKITSNAQKIPVEQDIFETETETETESESGNGSESESESDDDDERDDIIAEAKKIIPKLGHGAFGFVKILYESGTPLFLVTCTVKREMDVAEQKMKVAKFGSTNSKSFYREKKYTTSSCHPNVIKAKSYKFSLKNVALIMEYYPLGNVADSIVRSYGIFFEKFSFLKVLPSFLKDCIAGLFHLHTSLCVIHGDVKLENVLISKVGSDYSFIIADLGESFNVNRKKLIGLGSNPYQPEIQIEALDHKKGEKSKDFLSKVNPSIDYYSLGASIWHTLQIGYERCKADCKKDHTDFTLSALETDFEGEEYKDLRTVLKALMFSEWDKQENQIDCEKGFLDKYFSEFFSKYFPKYLEEELFSSCASIKFCRK